MRHLHITNETIVPVLNVTRLKHIKNSPFSDKSQKSQSDEPIEDENEMNARSEEVKADSTTVEICELPNSRKVCKPIAAIDKFRRSAKGAK